MAAPNLKQPLTITGKTAPYEATTSLASALSNGVSSGKVLKVNTIRAANLLTTGVKVDVTFYRDSTHYYLIENADVPPASALVVSDKNEYIYLEEGDSLYAKATTASGIHFTINYEDIS
jgi:hypothetical protein